MAVVAVRELKAGFRNPWAYSFMALFTVFMLSLLLIQSQNYVSGYSGATGTLLNLILYLLPLMTLTIGAFSLTGEKEDGSWELLSTYPLATLSFLAGKYAGLAAVMLTITAMGFGVAGLAGWAAGSGFSFSAFVQLFLFSSSLSLMFLSVAMLIGTLSGNRWQALTIVVAVWFFLIIAWQPILIAALGAMPYLWIKPALTVLTMLNPAELARLFTVVKLGGGSMLGPEYYQWIGWVQGPAGTWGFSGLAIAWIGVSLLIAFWFWERGRRGV
jgi:Cu-processing system permease protein